MIQTEQVVRTLVAEGRVGDAIEYAGQKLADGDESAAPWVVRIQAADRDQVSQIQYFLTQQADETLPDLLANDQEVRTKLWMADVDWAAYGDLRVRRIAPGRAEIALACWHVYTDTARYFGDNPPNEVETELAPDGTAIVDLALTVAIVNDLAARWNAVEPPYAVGSHLAIAVPLPAA